MVASLLPVLHGGPEAQRWACLGHGAWVSRPAAAPTWDRWPGLPVLTLSGRAARVTGEASRSFQDPSLCGALPHPQGSCQGPWER